MSNNIIDVEQFLDNNRFSAFQWTILVLCFLVVFIAKVVRFISVLKGIDTLPAMMDDAIEHPQEVEKMVVVL